MYLANSKLMKLKIAMFQSNKIYQIKQEFFLESKKSKQYILGYFWNNLSHYPSLLEKPNCQGANIFKTKFWAQKNLALRPVLKIIISQNANEKLAQWQRLWRLLRPVVTSMTQSKCNRLCLPVVLQKNDIDHQTQSKKNV